MPTAPFHFIEAPAGALDRECLPSFLLIGPNRTGSTWLHRQLSVHPEIFLTTPKELHYFSCLGRPKHELFRSNSLEWYQQHFRVTDEVLAARDAQCRREFGVPFSPRAAGEASASYAGLVDAPRLDDLARLVPDVKAVISVRNPVERAWSHVKFDLTVLVKRKLEDVPRDEVMEHVRNPYILRCGLYTEVYELWSSALRPGHLLPIVFDRIRTEPQQVCREVCEFIGVDADPRFFQGVDQSGRNPTEPSRGVPSPYREFLEQYYAPELTALRAALGVAW